MATRFQRTCLGVAVVSAVVAGVWYWRSVHTSANTPGTMTNAQAPGASSSSMEDDGRDLTAAKNGLPRSLAGSSAPRLPLDEHGRLMKVRAVREFFDYCLNAQSDLKPEELDALVEREIAAQLDATPAQSEALDVWHRYKRYLKGIGDLQQGGAPSDAKADGTSQKIDVAQVLNALTQRESLATREMGDWADAFFGRELAVQRNDAARIALMQNPSLSAQQKAAELDALDEALPADERELRAAAKHDQALIDQVASAQAANGSPDQLRDSLVQTIGADAADRVAQNRRDDLAWQAKYDAYAAQRAQIDASAQSPQAREQSIQQLRDRVFTQPGEAARAASFDAAPAK
ncbi:lipase secretion chaperone [Caballeronia insecticola]|uniref:Lipase chaperone n=1 Tax=Caballeronia insecticola TaxID=758793 RepID=R4X344_9BURK|nr:lipase secretion chaperone [Caballeronia insecticola]BAN26032.1 lipase chaperone [Caballeronia insecticola]